MKLEQNIINIYNIKINFYNFIKHLTTHIKHVRGCIQIDFVRNVIHAILITSYYDTLSDNDIIKFTFIHLNKLNMASNIILILELLN